MLEHESEFVVFSLVSHFATFCMVIFEFLELPTWFGNEFYFRAFFQSQARPEVTKLSRYSTVNRSPSGTNIYRHQTPPKEPTQSPFQHGGNNGADNDFVVHRSKGITTLFNMQEALVPAKLRQAKEKTNNDSKADERGEPIFKASKKFFSFSRFFFLIYFSF